MFNEEVWENFTLDGLIESVLELPEKDKTIKISRYHMMRMFNFECFNILLPMLISHQTLLIGKYGLYMFFSKPLVQEYPFDSLIMHLICCSILLFVANYFYSVTEFQIYENYWGQIFSIMTTWQVLTEFCLVVSFEDASPYQYAAHVGFGLLFLEFFSSYIEQRLSNLCSVMPYHITTLILPYEFLESPLVISYYLKWLDELLLQTILELKPERLEIQYVPSTPLQLKTHSLSIYLGIIEDAKKLPAGIKLDLRQNHLFYHLSRQEREWFIGQIPYAQRLQLDLSENGESECQRALIPMFQVSKKHDLNQNISREILSYLSNK